MHSHSQRPPADPVTHLPCDLLTAVELARHDHHVGPRLGEGQHHLPAQAATAARNHSDLSLQPEIGKPSRGHPNGFTRSVVIPTEHTLTHDPHLLSRTIVTV